MATSEIIEKIRHLSDEEAARTSGSPKRFAGVGIVTPREFMDLVSS